MLLLILSLLIRLATFGMSRVWGWAEGGLLRLRLASLLGCLLARLRLEFFVEPKSMIDIYLRKPRAA